MLDPVINKSYSVTAHRLHGDNCDTWFLDYYCSRDKGRVQEMALKLTGAGYFAKGVSIT